MRSFVMTRRSLLERLGFASILSVMAACAPAPAPTQTPLTQPAGQPTSATTSKPASDSVSGDVLVWGPVNLKFEEHIPEFIREYKERAPQVRLKIEAFPEDTYTEKLSPALASGGGPDILTGAFVPRLSRPKTLLELTSFINGPNGVDLNQWDRNAWEAGGGIIDGKIYGMPRDRYGGDGWFYNKELFDQAGVPYPKFGLTWKDLLETAPKLTDKAKRLYGVAIDGTVPANLFGFTPVTADGKTIGGNFDSPIAIDACKIWKKLYQYSPSLDQQKTEFTDVTGGGVGPIGAFLSKRTAIVGVDPGTFVLMDSAAIKWSYVNAPWPNKPEDRHKPTRNYVIWSINNNTKNPEGSWDFLKWMTSKEGGSKIMAKAGFFVPFRENLDAVGYPETLLDVLFASDPPEWKPPLPSMWSIPCFGEGGLKEWRSMTEAVLNSPDDRLEQLVHEGAKKAQAAQDACWAKQTG